MECNKDEAIRAKGLAEKKMVNNDFEGARNIALKARNLYPELENISQLITVCEVHCSSLKKINGAEKDLYGILQIETVADEATIRKQYRKLALALHPDKNKFPGAEAAFKLIGEANMILSDKGKRSLYDVKCRQPMKAPATKPQKPQTHGSYARKQFAGQNNFNNVPSSHFNGVNHQQQPPVSSLRPSFWTYCPFCNIKYEYYREFVNRPLRCQHCSKLFIAYDISAAGGVPGSRFAHEENQSANLGSNRAQPQPQPPFSHTEEVKRREKVKVNIQKDGQSSHFTHQTSNTKPEAAGSSKTVPKPMKTEPSKDTKKKRGRKTGAESGESSSDAEGGNGFGPAGNGVNYRKSSRQKPQVSYNEDAAADESSPLKRSRKSSDDVEDVKAKKEKEKVSGNADVDKEGHGNMPNGNHVNLDDDDDDDDSKSDSEPEFVNCPDLEFSNFDKDKEEDCFAVDQIWACYDSIDGMPRFYAKIRKVFKTQFKLKITWLEADPDDESEIKWAEEGLPVGCGKFMSGESEETKDRLMFSHKIVYRSSLKRNSFVIYPQKGEIWALFKDWDIKWGSDPENHTKFKFDIVEILDVHDNGSVSVALLVKVKGFVSLFKKTAWGGLNDRKIPGNEHLRFSHRIPSTKLTGAERAGVPPGSFELDTASLPDDLGDYYYSINPDTNNNNNNATSPKKNVNPEGKNGIDKDTLNVRRSPRGLKNPSDATATATSSKGSNSFCEDGNLPKYPKIIHDFSADTQIWKFHNGQIWAIWDTSNGIHQCYVKIIKIETPPFRLQVSFLKSCNNQSTVCGLFKVTPGKTKPLPPEVFSHVVKAEENGQSFSIYPREQQIWALNKRQDADCECEIVEVLESDESSVKVMSLTHVPGYKSVYKAPRVQRSSDNIVVIPQKEINRFSRHIPAFLFTEEKDGALRGCWELNPAALKGLPLKGSSGGQPN
ncbi:uncharacterized protein LOC111900912 [Lactuca sativa]|uniref:J domain-containing protein n=1 Tax=Lactuca sativa TaxID=4236 RepID=A0A9R1VUX3_LACSA|nr:uncharacterized protein LOC111900912 [Lactuca sativa]XP_023752550.1 uncharacterized protein LOC111900912 [Lactuca sativa]KAJ0212353.1 hypothetical protein LSAT_V11C400211530 [Lactuca sativa]